MVPPIYPAPKVEHDGLAELPVLDQKGKSGHVHMFMALLHRLYERFGRYHNIRCRIHDMHLYRRVGLGKVEGWTRFWLNFLVRHGCFLCSTNSERSSEDDSKQNYTGEEKVGRICTRAIAYVGKAGMAKNTINYERGESDVEDEHLDRNVFFDRGCTAGLIDKPMQAGRLPI